MVPIRAKKKDPAIIKEIARVVFRGRGLRDWCSLVIYAQRSKKLEKEKRGNNRPLA